jgi:hypothetical protein
MPPAIQPHDADGGTSRRIGRRTLLRRTGALVTLAGGAASVQAATSDPAGAAGGDPLVLGQANDSGASGSALTSSDGADATLTLGNTGTGRGPLALIPSDDSVLSSDLLSQGELLTNAGVLLFVSIGADTGDTPLLAPVHTDWTTPQVIGIEPVRMLDTRSASLRGAVVDPVVLDGSGRLQAGKWLQLDLSFLGFAEAAFVNLTAVSPTANGYLTLAPAPADGLGAPSTSSLNYPSGVTIGNAAVVAIADDQTIWIYSKATTHVVLDVTALNSSPELLDGAVPALRDARSSGSSARAAARRAAFTRSMAKPRAL